MPEVSDEVRAERNHMTRQLLVHTMAERERALAEGTDTPRSSRREAVTGLTDALVGLWRAPMTTYPGKETT